MQSSRCSRTEQSLLEAEDSGIYQNLNETAKIQNVNDILGPLPLVPSSSSDSDKNWSSRMSEIYEEIPDSKSRFAFKLKSHQQVLQILNHFRSKNVRGSAIYEEMRLNRPEPNSSPPPLPPRVRKNTDCSSLQRSYTTPESEMVKKKWNLFENVFGKSKRSETKRRTRVVQPQPRELQLLKAKRNSFSSPDLSHLDVSSNSLECANCSFDVENPRNISASNSYELEHLCEETEQEGNNITQNIKPNFELILGNDISSVNLIVNESYATQSQPSSSPPGYLEMRPGKGFDLQKVEELDTQIRNDVLYRLKYSFDSPINYKRESDYDQLPPARDLIYINERISVVEPHYVCMTKGFTASPSLQAPISKVEEPLYMPMNHLPAVTVDSSLTVTSNVSEITKSTSTRTKRHSVDEKISSYIPNYDVPVKINGSPHVRSSTAEGVLLRKCQFKAISPEPTATVQPNKVKTASRKTMRMGSFNKKTSNDNNNNDTPSPGISKKYATISRITVSNCQDDNLLSPKSVKKSGSISPTSIKRFTSLPRFKMIDFSPLRLKISSVLQRNNAGGC